MKRLLVAALAGMAALAPARAADPLHGAELYRRHCLSCHGANGRPVLPGAPDFANPTSLLKPDLQLLDSIRRGRGPMPSYAGVLRDRDILDLIAHLRTLR